MAVSPLPAKLMTIKAIASCRGIMRHCDHRRTICRSPAGGNVNGEFTIFTCNPTLAATIARELGAQLGSCVVDRYLFEAAGVLLTRVPKWSALKLGGRGSPSARGPARPGLPSRVSLQSFCTACGSTEPSSTGRRRRLLPSAKSEITEIRQKGGKRRPCRDDGDGEFDIFCASVRGATAIATAGVTLRHHAEGSLLPRREHWTGKDDRWRA